MASTFASRSYRDIGIVLRTQKLGEADRIITVLTAFHGLVRAVAKGVRRTSSKFGATLEPFMVADLQLVHGRSLDIITQAQGRSAYGTAIAADYEKYTVASAMAETAERLTETAETAETADRSSFDLLHGACSALARSVHPPDLVLGSYLLRAMSSAGWAVTWSECVACGAPGPQEGFHASAGGPVCADCRPPGSRNMPVGAPDFLHALQNGQWETANDAASDLRHEGLALVADYTQHHLERRLTSLRAYAH